MMIAIESTKQYGFKFLVIMETDISGRIGTQTDLALKADFSANSRKLQQLRESVIAAVFSMDCLH